MTGVPQYVGIQLLSYPKKIKAVIGLSVPHSRRGKISNIELWRQIYKDKFFYQLYFQKEGVAEEELEKDIADSLRKIYYWGSGEGRDAKLRSNPDKNSTLLDGLINPMPFPDWLSEDDLNFYVEQFKKAGLEDLLTVIETKIETGKNYLSYQSENRSAKFFYWWRKR